VRQSVTEAFSAHCAGFFRFLGGVLLLAGLAVAFLAPLEMYCYYLFAEGGEFAYEGFRFGSFMFGNLSAQIVGYLFIGSLLIPVGYGNLRLRSWGRHLSLALLRFWIVAGLPLIAAFLFVLVSSKEPSFPSFSTAGLLSGAAYLLLPWLGRRLYNHPGSLQCFQLQTSRTRLEAIPAHVLALSMVLFFLILVLFVQIFFNGVFPVFGRWLTGLTGIVMIDLVMFVLAVLVFGLVNLIPLAWWGTLVTMTLLTGSYLVTLATTNWAQLLDILQFPPAEMDMLAVLPLHGAHLAVLAGLPFLLALHLIITTRPVLAGKDRARAERD